MKKIKNLDDGGLLIAVRRRSNSLILLYVIALLWLLLISFFETGSVRYNYVERQHNPVWFNVELGESQGTPAVLSLASIRRAERHSADSPILGQNQEGQSIALLLVNSLAIYPLPFLLSILFFFLATVLMGYYTSEMYQSALAPYLKKTLALLSSILKSIPSIVLIVLISVILVRYISLDDDIFNLTIVFILYSAVQVPFVADGVRQYINKLESNEFIDSERSIGMSNFRIFYKHIFAPYVFPLLLMNTGILLSELIFIDINLSWVIQDMKLFNRFPSDVGLGYMLFQSVEAYASYQSYQWFFIEIAALIMLILFVLRFSFDTAAKVVLDYFE